MTNKCEHKWVMYQPFSGDAYECCALAGCGIRKDEYDKSTQMTFLGEHTITTSYVPFDLTRTYKSPPQDRYELDTDAPWNDGDKKCITKL